MALFILGGMFPASTTVPYTTHDHREPAYNLPFNFVDLVSSAMPQSQGTIVQFAI